MKTSQKENKKMNMKKIVRNAGLGLAGLAAVAVVSDGIVITAPDEVKMILTLGDPERFAPQGPSLKIPFIQSTFSATTSLEEYPVPQSSVGLQNGTITAEGIVSSAFIQFNGTREEREETLTLIRENMPDYEARITSLAESALRDTVRQTYIASAGSDEEQTVTRRGVNVIDFMDTEAVGQRVAERLQSDIDSVILGSVTIGEGEFAMEVPRVEVQAYRIGNFDFDQDYLARRDQVADARATAEAARFQEAGAERTANAAAAVADGERRATILRAEGDAEGIELRALAEANGLRERVDAAGGAEALRQQTLAEAWDGRTTQVIGGEGVIVDGRLAPGADVTAPIAGVPRPN
jgi:regulator of protease activity HflC (stomatin/prohibitin superfamily)